MNLRFTEFYEVCIARSAEIWGSLPVLVWRGMIPIGALLPFLRSWPLRPLLRNSTKRKIVR